MHQVPGGGGRAAASSLELGIGTRRVGWGFVSLYAAAYMSTVLLLLAPLLVTLALKVQSLVGINRAPNSLALVAGVGALLSMVANPFFGRMSDRTVSRLGMRRPWMLAGLVGGSLGILVVALAPSVPVVLVGWCAAQLCFNALQAALVAVLPDHVPAGQRGLVAGRARGLPAHRVGQRHFLRSIVRRQPTRHVSRSVCRRRLLRAAFRGPAAGSATRGR